MKRFSKLMVLFTVKSVVAIHPRGHTTSRTMSRPTLPTLYFHVNHVIKHLLQLVASEDIRELNIYKTHGFIYFLCIYCLFLHLKNSFIEFNHLNTKYQLVLLLNSINCWIQTAILFVRRLHTHK